MIKNGELKPRSKYRKTCVVAARVEFLEWADRSHDDFDIPDGFEPVDAPGDCIPF